MAEENKHGMTDAQSKLESSKTHARKAAEDLRDAAVVQAVILGHFPLLVAPDFDAFENLTFVETAPTKLECCDCIVMVGNLYQILQDLRLGERNV